MSILVLDCSWNFMIIDSRTSRALSKHNFQLFIMKIFGTKKNSNFKKFTISNPFYYIKYYILLQFGNEFQQTYRCSTMITKMYLFICLSVHSFTHVTSWFMICVVEALISSSAVIDQFCLIVGKYLCMEKSNIGGVVESFLWPLANRFMTT